MNFTFPLHDVSITVVEEIDQVSNCLFEDSFTRLNQSEMSFRLPEVAQFYISNGKNIQILVLDEAKESYINLYLNGTILGAIILQRKLIPLHACSLVVNGSAFVFCGEAGTGKSTLAYGLNKEFGIKTLSDDLSLLLTQPEISCQGIKGNYKLWRDALEERGESIEELESIELKAEKYYVNNDSFTDDTFPLKAISVITLSQNDDVEIQEISGTNKFQILINQIFRREFLKGMPDTSEEIFKQLVEICNSIPVYSIKRPEAIDAIDFQRSINNFIQNIHA